MKDCFQLSRFIDIKQYEPKVKTLKTSELLNKSFLITKCIRFEKGKYGKPFYKLHIVLDENNYIINIGSVVVISELDDLMKHFSVLEDINVFVKLIKVYGSYKLIDGDNDDSSDV
jgi:hypothetical protein